MDGNFIARLNNPPHASASRFCYPLGNGNNEGASLSGGFWAGWRMPALKIAAWNTFPWPTSLQNACLQSSFGGLRDVISERMINH